MTPPCQANSACPRRLTAGWLTSNASNSGNTHHQQNTCTCRCQTSSEHDDQALWPADMTRVHAESVCSNLTMQGAIHPCRQAYMIAGSRSCLEQDLGGNSCIKAGWPNLNQGLRAWGVDTSGTRKEETKESPRLKAWVKLPYQAHSGPGAQHWSNKIVCCVMSCTVK